MTRRAVLVNGVGLIALILLASWALLCAFHATGSAAYLAYVAAEAETIDVWAVLSLLDVVLAGAGIAGGFWFLSRRRRALAALFFLLPVLTPFLIEANRCDVFPMCYSLQWAVLPRPAFDWDIRIRDVGSRSARGIADETLREAGQPYSAWYPRLAAGQWRVETYDEDMARGPDDVVVDARTAEARIVPRQ